ncbi:MAG: hypothetical protein WDW38_003348 [Sanguina aurantia]
MSGEWHSRWWSSAGSTPPLMNDRALFTKAAPFGDKDDPYYHSPSSRIGGNYSPHAALAAAILFEEFPAGPNAPRTRAHPTRSAPGDGKGYHVGSRVLSPRPGSLPPLKAISPGRTAAAGLLQPSVPGGKRVVASPDTTPLSGAEPVSPGGPGEEVDGNSLSRSAKDARTGPLSTADTSMLVDAILRYYYYIEVGLDEAHVAPFRQEWAANVLQLVPQGPSEHVSQAFYDTLVCSTLEEMCHEYVYSMKKAMIDYVITSSVERARLNLGPLEQLLALPTPTQESWSAVVGRRLPPSWHINVDTAREEVAWTLQTLSANALELSKLWINSGFSRALLVDTSAEGFVSRLPMQAQAFRSHQAEVCELLKSSLWTSWAPKSVEIFNRLPPVFINGDADAYYRSIATMQGNQLRGLVQRSLQAYVTFFQLHGAVPQVDPQQDTLMWSVPPVFVLDLVQANGGTRYSPTFQECEDIVRSVLDAQVLAVAGLPRIGANMAGTTSFTSSSSAAAGPQPGGYSSSVIPTTGLQEEDVVVARKAVLAIVEANATAPQKLSALFEPWLWLLREDAEAEIDRLRSAAGTIRQTCTDDVRTGLYTIRCRTFKEQLAVAAEGLSVRLLDEVRSGVRHSNLRITEEYQVMTLEVGKASHSGEEALGLKKYMTKAHSDQEKLREVICRNREKEEFLMAHRFPIPEEDFEISMKAYEAPRRMVEVMKQAATKANSEHREYESQLKKRRKEFGEQLEAYAKDLESYHTKAEIIKRDVLSSEVNDLGAKLKAATEEAEYINTQEKMFGWATTKYGSVARMAAAVEPYATLWTTLSGFLDKLSTWMNGPFVRLNPEEVEAESNEAFRPAARGRCEAVQADQVLCGAGGGEVREGPLAMAEEGKARVAAFQEHMPLIGAICNAGLRDRHWGALADIVGFEIKRDEVTSLKRLLDHDISAHLPKVAELSDSASREWSIEKTMDTMTGDWEGLCFELGPWKETGTFILKGGPVDVAQGLLDDHIVKSQAMAASPFAKPFMDRLGPWESKLVRFQDILEAWLCCQGKWLYLEPIFGADEIMKQIPREGAAFRDMDDTWRRIMQQVKANAVMTEVAELPGLLEDLQHCNRQLDVVEKGLNDFLDTKKMAFPRFFFLSNDELLEILSEAKDPVNVQPFVKKCFEAVKELVFEADGEISGLISVEGEKLPFVDNVNPAATGAVECWLLEVESAIRRTLHKVAGDALEAYAREQRSSWILAWPGQLVLNCSQVYWTREVTQAISSGGAQGLSHYADQCTSELNQIVNLVRGQLTSIERATRQQPTTVCVCNAASLNRGTGKTETTKDLSKALAIQCVVFNCSDGLDFKAMGKFFKGLACSGAWACFDEFNRIELEVLSVVAQQILTIIRAKSIKAKLFVFEGVEMKLVLTCNVFITMNPGYAGRSELPDNLKALFRDVAMMVPDYAMIAEIMLYSYGYLEARSMARKLVQTYRVLAQALSDLASRNQNGEFHTKTYVLNPKSVTMGQLYGAEDAVSKEWTDGVLAVLFRNAARDTSTDRKWVIFDGPVDAIWIENMNTVLDDNKKLCLNSGEIVAMQGLMNMVFEVQDLAVASPATVSRCGMVYVQPALLGWRPVMLSWLTTLPPSITDAQKQQMVCLFDWLIPPCLRVALKLVRSPLPMQDINLAVSCMRLLHAHLDEWANDAAVLRGMTEQQQAHRIQALFLLSLVWSVGGGSDEEGRRKFDACLRRLLANDVPAELRLHVTHPAVKITAPFPEGRLVYDFVWDKDRSKWAPWMDTVASKALDVEAEYTAIIVPTVDTVRYTYLLHKFVTHGMHCLFVGPTGTGKSVYVKKHLQESLPAHYVHMLMTFSAQTSANMTQDIIDGKLDKRRRGVVGPPQGKKMVIFVDDLNMPQVEEYGAQPPVELLRQFMDHGGWYDRKELAFRAIQDVHVTNRYLRHFSVVSMTAFDNENLGIIFTALVDWWFRKYSYPPSLTRLGKPLVAASLEVYEQAQLTLLPTPTKSHYTFNLRDVSKVFQGITKAAGSIGDSPTMVRLWTHEVLRVFYDRLVDDEDRKSLAATLAQLSEKHFKEQAWAAAGRGQAGG